MAKKLWFRCVLAYTMGGLLSATLVGLVLGILGRELISGSSEHVVYFSVGCLAMVLAARELGWINFQIPESKRHSVKWWAHEFGFVTASAMWGFHIGLGFATRITYGGFWVLVAIAVASRSPMYGALLMIVYWIGRSIPIWLSRTLFGPTSDSRRLFERVANTQRALHASVAIALAWTGAIVFLYGHP